MTNLRAYSFLQRVLFADAAISGATGLLMLAGADLLGPVLGVPAMLLRVAGALLIPFAVAVSYIARRTPLARGPVWTIVLLNALWVAGSLWLALGGWIEPTGIGIAFVLFQAAVVAGFAELQVSGLRRAAA